MSIRRQLIPTALRLPCAAATAILLLSACTAEEPGRSDVSQARRVTRDLHSFSRPDQIRVTHAVLDWTVDFDARQLRGSVTWSVEREPGSEGEPLVLDTKGLVIESVVSATERPVTFELGTTDDLLGTPLLIAMDPGDDEVTVFYHAGPEAPALQWLTTAQTAGEERPFVYSGSTAIGARTFWPCQDSPAVRFTYEAELTVPADLTAVMAAEMLPGGDDPTAFRFRMSQPIPSYLVAFAVGGLQFRELGPRTGVYAEPPVLDAAAFEFADAEAMLEAAERLYGPYRWDRYDLLVMPPSFPVFGMENPRLTFVNPAVIAGDRSLISTVAHELAHSWSGNLVDHATWSDLWLNEGLTVYIERRILESLYGRAFADMEAVKWNEVLMQDLATLEDGFTALRNVSLEGRDPRDGLSEVPYSKGYLFLRFLEEEVGRDAIDTFLRSWFDDNAFQSRTTMDFEEALRERLFGGDDSRMQSVEVEEWLYGAGLPENAPVVTSARLDNARAAARAFAVGDTGASDLPAVEWSTHEWIEALRAFPDDVPVSRVAQLDAEWSLSETANAEIMSEWLQVCVRSGYHGADDALKRFLTRQGRLLYLRPLYRELVKTPEGRERALAIYADARPRYHRIAVDAIEEILAPES